MTQKPEKLVCSKRRVWEGCTQPRRGSRTSLKPTLLQANPEDNVAEKLVEHCDRSRHTYPNNAPNSREFASWFRRPIKNIQPDCLITSHQSKPQMLSFQSKTGAYPFYSKNRIPSHPMYPSLVDPTVKWNANMPTSFVSVDDSQEDDQHDDYCWCPSCTKARHRVGLSLDYQSLKMSPSPTFDRPVFFRDNIVTFCNQHTMTPRLNDVSCGSSKCAIPVLFTAEVGTSGPDLNAPQSSKTCRQNSILKKSKCDTYQDVTCFAKAWLDHKLSLSCDDDDGSNGKAKPTKCCPRPVCLLNDDTLTNEQEPDANRKMLYNEGISDDVAKEFCVMHRKHSPKNDLSQRIGSSRLSVGAKCYRNSSDNYIPYSHNINSKYHQNCKKEVQPLMRKRSCVFHGFRDDECRTLEIEPLVLKNTSAGACTTRSRCISLPKKLLTSEKNIEAFLNPKCIR